MAGAMPSLRAPAVAQPHKVSSFSLDDERPRIRAREASPVIAQGAGPPPLAPPPASYGGPPAPPPASPYGVPPPMPPARPAPAPGVSRVSAATPGRSQSRDVGAADPSLGGSAAVSAAHVRRLAALALDLEAQIADGCDAAAIRRIRQRLIEWIEDLRSVGGRGALADAVEARVRWLSDALAAPMNLAAEIKTIADELAQLATAALPPDAGGVKPGRPPFWK